VAKTLLAVDDSVTMRKVLEITFSGEDFRVVTADTTQTALGKMSENPNVCVIDTSLGGEDGYALAKEVRKRNPGTSIIMLASRYAPYDQARGRDAGADDWADKPFDTQQLIEKVRKIVLAKEASSAGTAAPPPPPPSAPRIAPAGIGRGTQPSLGGAVAAATRPATLMFGETPPGAPAARPAAPTAVPAAAPAPTPTPATAPPAIVAAAVNGRLSGKLSELGLTQQQADAVLALSREVVERIVWEVVPQLAETLIKEEIARLTQD
jgi:CheY-like chemotaxis protein